MYELPTMAEKFTQYTNSFSDRPILLTDTDIYRYRYRYIGIGILISVSVYRYRYRLEKS